MGYTELIRGLLVYEVMGSHRHTYHREPSDASLMEDYSLIFMQISVVPKEPHPNSFTLVPRDSSDTQLVQFLSTSPAYFPARIKGVRSIKF